MSNLTVRDEYGYGIELVFVPVLSAVLGKKDAGGVALRREWRALAEPDKRRLFIAVVYAAMELGESRGAEFIGTAWSISPTLTNALIGKALKRAQLAHKSAKHYSMVCCPTVFEKRNPGSRVSKLEGIARKNQETLDRWLGPEIPRKRRG